MLVLTRNDGQSVVLILPDGRQVRVTVRRHRHDKWDVVRLAFDAPPDVVIWRQEIAPARGEVRS